MTLRCPGVGAYLSRKAPLAERKMSATSRRGRLCPGWAAHGSMTIAPYLAAAASFGCVSRSRGLVTFWKFLVLTCV